MTRYVIIGAGAVGASVAAQLTLAGIPAVLVARGRHGAALRQGGLRYVRPDTEHLVAIEVASGPDEVRLEADDVLVLATKSQDTEQALKDWAYRPVRGADTLPLLVLQNGMENERSALRRFPVVLGAVVWLPSSHLSPGEVVAAGSPAAGAFWIGAYPGGHSAVAEAVAADLRSAGFHASTVPDIVSWKAAKLLANLANALDALYRPSDLRDRAAEALRDEGRRVLHAHGVQAAGLDGHAARVRAEVRMTDVPGRDVGHSSTWQSLVRAGGVETDFLNGEIVLLARLSGLRAPLNAALQRRIQRAVREGTEAGSLTDDDLVHDLPDLPTRPATSQP